MGGAKRWARRAAMGSLLVLMVAGLLALFWAYAHPYAARGAVPLVSGWRVRVEGEATFRDVERLDTNLLIETGRALTMTRRMTERAEGASILLHLDYLRARVWVGDELIFTNEHQPPGDDKGISRRLIALPEGYLGLDLTLEVSSGYRAFSASPDVIWFGSAEALAAHERGNAAASVTLMFILALSGLALMVFTLAVGAGWDGVWFALLCVLYALVLPGMASVYLGALAPRPSAALHFALYGLFPAPLLWFVFLKCGAARRLALCLAAAYSALALGVVGAMVAGRLAPPEMFDVISPAQMAAAVCVCALCAWEWARKTPFFRMAAPAFVALVVSGALMFLGVPENYIWRRALLTFAVLLLVALVWADMLRDYRARRRREVEQRQLLSMREHLAGEQLEAADAQSHETRLLRHEIRHHLSALSMLQSEGKLREIGEYIRALDAQEQSLPPALYCEHPLVNAILCKAGRDCARHGIVFSCEADVPEGIDVPDSDLCALLLNMLDNACEAARQVERAQKWVAVQIQLKGRFLAIRCANSIEGEVQRDGETLVTTKKDACFHGYGIPAMRRVAERNGGKLNIDYDGERFSVKTIMRLGS